MNGLPGLDRQGRALPHPAPGPPRRTALLPDGVRDEQRDSPTPCAEYTVDDLIAHVDEVAQGLAAVAGSSTRHNTVPAHVQALGEAWDDPAAWEGSTDAGGVELSNELWGKIALTEVVVHGWDLAQATGQSFELPEETLRACFEHVREFVPNAPLPELWGKPVDTPPEAPLLDRIVAITGRSPRPEQLPSSAEPGRR